MEDSGDTVNLLDHQSIKKILTKANEKLLLSCAVQKFNRKDVRQERLIMITDKAFYNMKKTSIKRRIELNCIVGVTTSAASTEFVLHVPSEYDYRYSSTLHRESVVKTLKQLNSKLELYNVPDTNLKKYTTTKKDKEKHISRIPKQEELVAPVEIGVNYGKNDQNSGKDMIKQQDTGKMIQDLNLKSQQVITRQQVESNTQSCGVQSTQREQQKPLRTFTPVTLDDFNILKVVGRGNFGKVMMAQKKDNGQFYAIKSIRKSMISNQQLFDYLKMEKRVLEIVDFPFLVKLQFAFQTTEKIFFVMDFLKGGEIFQHLKRHRCFSEEIVRFFAAEVLLALEYMHGKKIIYRDLKPENVLLDENGHVCLTDFGMAKQFEIKEKEILTNKNQIPNKDKPNLQTGKGPLTSAGVKPTSGSFHSSNTSDRFTSDSDGVIDDKQCSASASSQSQECSNSFVGTPQYLSPEIISRSTHTYSTDVWQLGLFIYELLVGYPPFFDQSTQVVLELIAECRVMYPQHVKMSEECHNIIALMLQKDPAKRITLEGAKQHPWFKGMDWMKLAKKEVVSPFIPPTSGDQWVKGFDEDFTQEIPMNSVGFDGIEGIEDKSNNQQQQQHMNFDDFKDYNCSDQEQPQQKLEQISLKQ